MQWTVKQISDNEIYLLIKYIKSVLWRVAISLSYIEEARCLKVKSAEESFQSTTGIRGLRISGSNGSNAGYTCKSTGYPLHSPVSASLPLPCVTVRHQVSTELYCGTAAGTWRRALASTLFRALKYMDLCFHSTIFPCAVHSEDLLTKAMSDHD